MADFRIDLNDMDAEHLKIISGMSPEQIAAMRGTVLMHPVPRTKMPAELLAESVPGMVILAAIVAVFYFRFARRRETEMTIRAAIEKGQNLGPEALEMMLSPPRRPSSSVKPGLIIVQILMVLGIVAISVAIGLALTANVFHPVPDELLVASVMVGAIGVGVLVAARILRKSMANA